jgi:hypothetical protein
MKHPDERAAFRIKCTQVRTLVRIAVVAGERGFRCRLFRHAGERRCARRDRRRTAPRFGEGSSIRSDDRHVHGRFAEAARPSGGMTFSQEPTSFRLQNGNEISDTDHCFILVTLLRGKPSFGAFVCQFLDPTLHLRVSA